jgi:hypothetical protein
MTTKKFTLAPLTDEGLERLATAKEIRFWRIRDASMAPEFLPGDSLYVSPRLVPETGDLVVARLADGSPLIGRYKAGGGKKAFDVVPADKRRPVERILVEAAEDCKRAGQDVRSIVAKLRQIEAVRASR